MLYKELPKCHICGTHPTEAPLVDEETGEVIEWHVFCFMHDGGQVGKGKLKAYARSNWIKHRGRQRDTARA